MLLDKTTFFLEFAGKKKSEFMTESLLCLSTSIVVGRQLKG